MKELYCLLPIVYEKHLIYDHIFEIFHEAIPIDLIMAVDALNEEELHKRRTLRKVYEELNLFSCAPAIAEKLYWEPGEEIELNFEFNSIGPKVAMCFNGYVVEPF